MLYVYRSVPSLSARDLATAIEGRRMRQAQNLRNGDIVICWGSRLAQVPQGVRTLNNVAIGNKLQDVERLRTAGVPTITISQTRPAPAVARPAVAAAPAIDPFLTRLAQERDRMLAFLQSTARPTAQQFADFQARYINLQNDWNRPITPARAAQAAVMAAEWLPRIINHVGGLDLLTPPARPEFWVRKENITEEFRVHSFLGRSIRSAKKVRREDIPDAQASAWVRSWDGGWKMSYADGALSGGRNNQGQAQQIRDLAHSAVRALGLDFGAVDIGKKDDGTFVVLEVNRAPGLSEGTAEVYGNAVRRWVNGELVAAPAEGR